jgi:lycopene beta-cyclase
MPEIVQFAQSVKRRIMTGRRCDIAIVGGGLAGGLIALALARSRPDLKLCIVEGRASLAGQHRWSWFTADLPPEGEALLAEIPQTRWDDGYDVTFPDYQRHLTTPYRSMTARGLSETLARYLPADAILTGCEARTLSAGQVVLRDGTRIEAGKVIDCRGFTPTGDLRGGWQVFKGRLLTTHEPHGVTRPVIMDATVEQLDGYRFMYLLPLSETELFIEDTYYRKRPLLDREELARRISQYIRAKGWQGEIETRETGVLPVITGGDFLAYQKALRIPGVAVAGARGGFVHPLTSYTLACAVETALFIAQKADLPGEKLARVLERRAKKLWKHHAFYRALGAMLFEAAEPETGYRVFQRFYRLRQPLIEHFYAGVSRWYEKVRILAGRPPVSVRRAIVALATRGAYLLPQDRD